MVEIVRKWALVIISPFSYFLSQLVMANGQVMGLDQSPVNIALNGLALDNGAQKHVTFDMLTE